MVDLNKLAAEIHEAAVKKGFWDVEDAEEKHLAKMISELGEVVQADRAGVMYEVERDGAKPEGVIAELADFVMMALDMYAYVGVNVNNAVSVFIFDDYRTSLGAEIAERPVYNVVNLLDMALNKFFNPDTIADVNGCVLVTTYGTCCWTLAQGFDLWEIIRQKMAYNESRPALHGRKY